MSVYKTKCGIYRIQFMLNGRNYVKTSKTTTKKVAELMEAQWRKEIHDRQYLGGLDEIKVSTLIQNYMKLPHASSTIKNATCFFMNFCNEVNTHVNASEFNQDEILKYVQRRLAKGIKQATIRTQLLYLSGAWNDGNKKLFNIPTLTLPALKRSPIKTEYLSEDDEQKLFSYIQSRPRRGMAATEAGKNEVYDVFVLLLDTGCRHNEICRLEWRNIDLKNRKIELYRKKTGTQSYIQMTNRVHSILQRRSEDKKHNVYVFANKELDGHRQDYTTHLNKILNDAGLPFSVHQLRHTFASKLLKAGLTLGEIQTLLGHSSIVSTMRYSHLEKSATSAKAVDVLNAQQVELNRSVMRVV